MRAIKLGLTVASALGIAAYAGQVQAATEYSMIVLDQTGSMTDPSTVNNLPQNGAPVGTGTKFDSAVTAAINWVNSDSGDLTNTRLYAIYTFKDDNCCGGTQTGLQKIWPKSTTGTTPGCSTGAHVTSDLFCSMDSAAGYGGVITLLNTLRPLQTIPNTSTTVGGDPNHLLNPINDSAGNPITTGGASFDKVAFGLGPNTPLANSLCKGADHLIKLSSNQFLTITLETDGNENFSTFQALKACSGTTGGLSDPNATAFPKTTADWGLPVGSWQGNVTRRLVRLVGTYAPPSDPLASAANASANDTIDGNAIVVGGAIKAKNTPGAEDVPPQTTWRVDVHYAICDPNYPLSPAPCSPTTPSAAVAAPLATMHALLSLEQPTFSPAPLPPPRKVKSANGTVTTLAVAAPLAAATSGRTQSLPTTELSYFKALGHVTPKSSFRAFIRDPLTATTLHVPKYPGDVDDSGCVDMADYNIVTQKDVYYKATVDSSNNQVNQLAVRADLDGDGWVTKADATIVVSNWGKGNSNCKITQPKPVIKF